MREASTIMEDQDELMTRKSEFENIASEANNKAFLEDIGQYSNLGV